MESTLVRTTVSETVRKAVIVTTRDELQVCCVLGNWNNKNCGYLQQRYSVYSQCRSSGLLTENYSIGIRASSWKEGSNSWQNLVDTTVSDGAVVLSWLRNVRGCEVIKECRNKADNLCIKVLRKPSLHFMVVWRVGQPIAKHCFNRVFVQNIFSYLRSFCGPGRSFHWVRKQLGMVVLQIIIVKRRW